ncbi:MAG: Rrf2 family transcriptional regulator [Candidatus Omnitrophota bacterium]|jgi:Rrf2 family protein
MKLITRDTDYALRAICFIAKNKNKKVSVSRLVKELKIPRPFLRKILQVLNKKNILISHKGIGGGFVLANSAKKITLTDLIKIFQGPVHLNECLFKKRKCPNTETCPLRKKIKDIEKYVVKELNSVTLASLM